MSTATAIGRDFTEDLDSQYTGLSFDSEKAAFEWAKKVSNGFKFNIIRGSKRKRDEELYHHYFTCECVKRCESEQEKKQIEVKNQKVVFSKGKKRLTSSKRVGCDFRGVIRMEEDCRFYVSVFVGIHDHPLIYFVEGNANYVHLNENDKLNIREMFRAHCKPKMIVKSLQYTEAQKPYLVKPVNNYLAKLKKEETEGRNPARQFLQQAQDNNYFIRVEPLVGTDQLRDMFWSHPNALKLLRRYPSVIRIDATYSTNKYNYALVEFIGVVPTNQNFTAAQALLQHEDKASYLWVMRRLAELLGPGVNPTAIVTNRELDLFEPIAMVFPGTHHLLCMHHVKKVIRTKAVTVMSDEKEGDSLFFRAVTRMLEAPFEEEFYVHEKELREKYCWVPSFIKYLDDIWMPHKEKICLAWTNKVRHFGNNTTNRVESAHSALKNWMISCRAPLDTFFEKTFAEVESRTKEIRGELEKSRGRNLYGFDCFPYMELLRKVSHYCLIELKKEFEKDGICTHAFPETHGLPCRCKLEYLRSTKGHVSLDEVDSFWTKLAYDGEEVEERKCVYDIHRTVEDYERRDVADQQSLSQKFHVDMYPEECAYEKPVVNLKKKGRPRKGKSTQNLLEWQHVQKKLDKLSGGKSSHGSNTVEQQNLKGGRYVPVFVREYLLATNDVKPDGNCGFRCAALRFLKDENRYSTIRSLIVGEIRSYRKSYKHIYKKGKESRELDKAIERIDWKGKRCTAAHWMQIPCDLYALAQIFGAVISVYTVDKLDRHSCCTVFPWRGEIEHFEKLEEMSIISMSNELHCVLGRFSIEDGTGPDNPLPMVHSLWHGIRNRSLRVWEEETYADRLARFKNLQSLYNGYKESLAPSNKKKSKGVVIYDVDEE